MESNELRLKWIEKGFLLPSEGCKKRGFEFKLFGKLVIVDLRTSNSGLWDDFTNSGTVHTNFLAIRRCHKILEDDSVLSFSKVVFWKWCLSVGVVNCV